MARSSSSGNNVDKGIKRNRNYPLDRSPGVQQLSHKFVDLTLEPDDNDDGIPYPKRPRQNGSNEPSGRKILPYDLLGNSIEDAIEITDDDDDTLLKDIMVECSLEDGVLDGTLDNDLAGDLLDDTDGRRASKRKASLSITASRSPQAQRRKTAHSARAQGSGDEGAPNPGKDIAPPIMNRAPAVQLADLRALRHADMIIKRFGVCREPRREDPSAMHVLAGVIGRSFVAPSLLKRASQEPSLALDIRFKKKTGGAATNKILQIQGNVIIAGLVEAADGRKCGPSDANLILWDEACGNRSVESHWKHETVKGNHHKMFYHIHDITKDPANPYVFASSGYDGWVNGWSLESGVLEKVFTTPSYPKIHPLDVQFRPVESALAVAYSDGVIQVYGDYTNDNPPVGQLRVVPVGGPHNHAVGPMAWGYGPRSHLLYASSEPPDESGKKGWHCRFEVVTGTRYCYDALNNEAGDAIAVDAQSGRLALFTTGDKPFLRLLDDRERLTSSTHNRVELPSTPYKYQKILEVTHPSFSPDGVLLAVPRSDNATLIYDTRFLSIKNRPLFALHHEPPQHESNKPHHGIVEAQWIENRFRCAGLGLVTGGNDGCVRVWDLRRAIDDPENGVPIATLDEDIAHFSIGAQYSEERPLVVGDNSGDVWIFK